MTAPRHGRSAEPLKYSVDPWDPSYGIAYVADTESDPGGDSTAALVLDVETPARDWTPISPEPSVPAPRTVLFIDGVRRIDARIWVHNVVGQPTPGIAASYAAGVVCCDDTATIAAVYVARGLFTPDREAADLVTRLSRYHACRANGPGLDELSLALQQHLTQGEIDLALTYRADHPALDDLIVVDGPLRGRTHLERGVGYIKTHYTSYLPADQAAVVTQLLPGQRSPVFTIGTSWIRHTWYLALPTTSTAPWAGIVRVECSADLAAPDATRLADITAHLLPRFASEPHKDPRAPQNLVPIGGLERHLRHRLGDQQLLYRTLRSAATA